MQERRLSRSGEESREQFALQPGRFEWLDRDARALVERVATSG